MPGSAARSSRYARKSGPAAAAAAVEVDADAEVGEGAAATTGMTCGGGTVTTIAETAETPCV